MLKVLAAATAALIFAHCAFAAPEAHSSAADLINSAQLTTPKHARYSPALVKAEILLARAHFSPGVIDGANGANARRAIAAFAQAHKLRSSGALNKNVWNALNADHQPVLTTYEISVADAAGPYLAKIPVGDMAAESKLKAMSFTSAREALAEKFHMSEGFLQALNPRVDFLHSGEVINVAAVDVAALPKVDKIVVNKSNNSVSAYDASNSLVGFFPATVGSVERPAPTGDFAVRAVVFDPAYYYDPDRLTFGGGDAVGKLKIAPGPNNPVGSVWIALTIDTFGIHGGPDPELIGKASSHGCVRLTNWDAVLLAKAVRVGTVVNFVGAARS